MLLPLCGFLPLLVIASILPSSKSLSSHPKALIVAFDGMRYDNINPVRTPFLYQLAQEGAFAPDGIQNQMFTVTAPNFFSISTGLYEENHGIMGNKFYDPVYNEVFDYFNKTKNATVAQNARDEKWYSGEPVWQTNELSAGRRSGAMRWPMCDAAVNGKLMQLCQPFNGYHNLTDWKSDIDTLIGWFTHPTNPINFGLYYNPFPDHTQHEHNIYGAEVLQVIRSLDTLVAYIYKRLEDVGLLNKINIVFMADHGFTNVNNATDLVDLDEILDKNDYIQSYMSLFPRTDRGITAKYLYDKLKTYRDEFPNFDVFMKEDIPEDWHYKNNRRVGPVVLVEKLGTWIVHGLKGGPAPTYGRHGYSKYYPEMRPFFVAHGPAFKSGYKLEKRSRVENVDVYGLLCHLLGVRAAPNDGSLARVGEILKNPPPASSCEYNSVSKLLILFCLGFVFPYFAAPGAV